MPEWLRLELLVLQETGTDHTESRSLYPAQGVSASSCRNGYGLGGIDTHQPVGFAAGTGGIIEIVIRRSALQMGKSLFDGFVRKRTDPQTVEGFGDAEILVDEPED